MRSFQLAAFGAPLVATEGPVPAPEGRQVLLRTLACGVCHSDVHLADGFFDLGNGNRIDLARSLRLPRTLGHEIVGQVAALGPEAVEEAVLDDSKLSSHASFSALGLVSSALWNRRNCSRRSSSATCRP